jgi:hypothetical protein
MEKILEIMATSEFWVLVVIFGILINLTAAYLKAGLDQVGSSVSLRWATRTEEQRQQRLRRIERLKGNTHEQLLASFAGVRAGIWSVFVLVFSTGLLLFAYMLRHMFGNSIIYTSILLQGLVGICMAFMFIVDLMRMTSEIREVRQSEDSQNQAHS